MTAETRTDRFVEALHRMDEGEAAPLLELFAEGATLQRPEKDASGADQGSEEFWRQYREVFSSLSTEFVSVREEGDLGVLEWTSTGTLTTGREVSYAGVSLLEFSGDLVQRFATYYDTAAFVSPEV
ncbi:nuclear transport factor 2 family protein [Micrococcus luteus]|uniref:nuclear transport factor 2 family protein n=1 Tax=Micrococcus luteus TaxID=1270 RepID=UPI00385D3277